MSQSRRLKQKRLLEITSKRRIKILKRSAQNVKSRIRTTKPPRRLRLRRPRIPQPLLKRDNEL